MQYLFTFDSTHQAMHSEKMVKENHLKARLIPVPEVITAGCGLALRVEAKDVNFVQQLLSDKQIVTSGCYEIQEIAGKKNYLPYHA